MSDSGDGVKYKWTPESTALLVSVWSDKQVQKQLEYAAKPQLIWESVARYMKKKGYNVSGKQCRSRMKQLLVCYREAKRAGTRAGVEQYYESIDRVLKSKRLEENNIEGIDTVDATVNVKSPPKEVKTNKNLQMRHKFQEPVQSLYRTEALSPTWAVGRENEYPDSPESNETIIARPYGVFSPTRDVGINTGEQLSRIAGKSVQCNFLPMEEPVRANYKQSLLANYPYGEVPYQNTVQNVQNQIIQENMQQHQNIQQNRIWNHQNTLANNLAFQQNVPHINQCLSAQPINLPVQTNGMVMHNPNLESVMQQQQNQFQQNQFQQTAPVNNRAMPQEPRKLIFGDNLMGYKQYRDTLAHMPLTVDAKQTGSMSPDYSPDLSQNLNDAFCQSTKSEDKSHNLNETFNQSARNVDVSMLTNNATCNDDSLLLEFLLDSPTLSENDHKSRDTAVNTESIPNAPLRKKKAQKLEHLVISAINSQNDVVNKILAAQNDMVTKFLDIDRDRQNRLENRLDDLLKVVHASVINKSPEKEVEIPPPPPEPTITSLFPPPPPGVVPPKLDLVPPKPCRVPCTVANANIELINQNPLPTRPGVVSPIMSPAKKPGTIWSKLGPVSQSPFVKAQQRLGLQPTMATDTRTQSSAERRIAREVGRIVMDTETLIFETNKFLEMERQLEETIENARLEMTMGQTMNARRRLFTQREPNAAMLLTAAFLEAERRAAERDFSSKGERKDEDDDNLLAGQGESYERLRQLNVHSKYVPGEPCDSSTPAKITAHANDNNDAAREVPKQTIHQLARLVMNSERWREATMLNGQRNIGQPVQSNLPKNPNVRTDYNVLPKAPRLNAVARVKPENELVEKDNLDRDQDWNRGKFAYGNAANDQRTMYGGSCNNVAPPKPKFPMGFTTAMLDAEPTKLKEQHNNEFTKTIGFIDTAIPERKQQSVRFMDDALAELQRMYAQRIAEVQQNKNDSLPFVQGNSKPLSPQSQQMLEKYMRQHKDNKDTDSDNDEDYLDTTATMPTVVPRRGSLTSTGTSSTETAHSMKFNKFSNNNCLIS